VTEPVRLGLALTALLFVLACTLAQEFCSALVGRLALAAILFVLLIGVPYGDVRGLAFGLTVLLLETQSIHGVGQGLLVVTMLSTLAGWFPDIGDALSAAATAVARWSEPPSATPQVVGPSTVGLPLALAALILVAIRARTRPRGPALFSALLVTAFLFGRGLLVAWLHPYIGVYAQHGHPPGPFRGLDFLSIAIPGAAALAWLRPAESLARSDWTPLVTLLAGAASLGAGVLLFGDRLAGEEDRRVAFLNVGGLDWKRPNVEEVGVYSTGMFGLLPVYLESFGWEVRSVGIEEAIALTPETARVLVVINCHHEWSLEERESIDRFVRSGGSLLVLGDHTDVFGLMRGLNTLLADWGIEFCFDSAYYAKKSWEGGLTWTPGLLDLGLPACASGIAIGASLHVRYPARSILRARYGFSDEGDRENWMGSFLGNYSYDPGERLGDIDVIAGVRRGRGRVVVFGDTSGFQNGSLATSHVLHVERLLRDLSRIPRPGLSAVAETLCAAALLACVAWATVGLGARGRSMLIGLAVGFLIAGCARWLRTPCPELRDGDLARSLIMDDSHFPDTGHYRANWNTIVPLETAAMRSGLLVHHMDRWDARVLSAARAVAIVAPTRTLEERETEDLLGFVRAGGTVILAANGEPSSCLRPFLSRLGVEIDSRHMGPIPDESRQIEREPRFVDASRIHLTPGHEARALYAYGEDVLAVALPEGRGQVLVVGDGRFFSSRNVEGIWGWWSGNVRFLLDIFATYCDGDPGSVRPRFDPPLHPDDG
jgi:hypothetical protein